MRAIRSFDASSFRNMGRIWRKEGIKMGEENSCVSLDVGMRNKEKLRWLLTLGLGTIY